MGLKNKMQELEARRLAYAERLKAEVDEEKAELRAEKEKTKEKERQKLEEWDGSMTVGQKITIAVSFLLGTLFAALFLGPFGVIGGAVSAAITHKMFETENTNKLLKMQREKELNE